jgi:hypothetical protein
VFADFDSSVYFCAIASDRDVERMTLRRHRCRRLPPSLALVATAAIGLSACSQPMPVVVTQPARQVVVAPVCDTSFRVINRSGLTVRNLQFSHSSRGAWGPDQLGANMLVPGQAMSFRAANTGNYDFRATWVNGRATERFGVNVCTTTNVVITNGGIAVN